MASIAMNAISREEPNKEGKDDLENKLTEDESKDYYYEMAAYNPEGYSNGIGNAYFAAAASPPKSRSNSWTGQDPQPRTSITGNQPKSRSNSWTAQVGKTLSSIVSGLLAGDTGPLDSDDIPQEVKQAAYALFRQGALSASAGNNFSAHNVTDLDWFNGVEGSAERQQPTFYRFTVNAQQAELGFVVLCRSLAKSNFKLALFGREGDMLAHQTSNKVSDRNFTQAALHFTSFPTYKMHTHFIPNYPSEYALMESGFACNTTHHNNNNVPRRASSGEGAGGNNLRSLSAEEKLTAGYVGIGDNNAGPATTTAASAAAAVAAPPPAIWPRSSTYSAGSTTMSGGGGSGTANHHGKSPRNSFTGGPSSARSRSGSLTGDGSGGAGAQVTPLTVLSRLDGFTPLRNNVTPGVYLLCVYGDNTNFMVGKSTYKLSVATAKNNSTQVEVMQKNDELLMESKINMQAMKTEYIQILQHIAKEEERVESLLAVRDNAYLEFFDASVGNSI